MQVNNTSHKIVREDLLYQIQNILVVNKFDVAPIDFFLLIFFLLHLKHVLENSHNRKGKQLVTRKFCIRSALTKIAP